MTRCAWVGVWNPRSSGGTESPNAASSLAASVGKLSRLSLGQVDPCLSGRLATHLIALMLVLVAGGAQAQPDEFAGSEFAVNSFTTNRQYFPDVAVLDDGSYAVVWQSLLQGVGVLDLYGRVWDADNQTLVETALNPSADLQQNAAVAGLGTDQLVVVWDGNDGTSSGVFGQRYDRMLQPVGAEFQVNQFTTGPQFNAKVATSDEESFVVVWESTGQDGSGGGVYARRFSDLGALGNEFRVNSQTTGGQSKPAVAMAPGGEFVVTWQSENQDGSDHGIFAQRYSSSGAPQLPEFQVNSWTTGSQDYPDVAIDAEQEFTIVWRSPQDGSSTGIYSQRFDDFGTPLGSERQINQFITGTQSSPTVSLDAAGNGLITWQSFGPDGDGYGISARPMNGDTGFLSGPEFQINSESNADQESPRVGLSPTGSAVLVWQSDGQDGDQLGVFGQRLNTPRSPRLVGPESEISSADSPNATYSLPKVASLNNDFAAVWRTIEDGDYSVRLRLLDPAGVAQSSEFVVASAADDFYFDADVAGADDFYVVSWTRQGLGPAEVLASRIGADGGSLGDVPIGNTTSAFSSAIAASTTTGDFVVVWEGRGANEDSYGVFGQRFDRAGTALGSRLHINTTTSQRQSDPDVSMRPNGEFVVVWESEDPGRGAVGPQLFGQRMAADGQKIASEFRVNELFTGDPLKPAVAHRPDGGFVVSWQRLFYGSSAVQTRSFDASGQPENVDQFVGVATSSLATSRVAIDSFGRALITWGQTSTDGSGVGVRARELKTDGTLRPSFVANTYAAGSQIEPAVASNDDSFLVVWRSLAPPGTDRRGIFGQLVQTPMFDDGFESGDLDGWSTSVP